jgi:hypothetical protein
MSAHIRLVSSETESPEAALQGMGEGNPSAEEAPSGLPGESLCDDLLGEAASALVAEPEARVGRRIDGDRRVSGLSKLIALAWPPRKRPFEAAGAAAADAGDLEKEGLESHWTPLEGSVGKVVVNEAASAPENDVAKGSADDHETHPRAADESTPPLYARKGPLAAALLVSVAIAAIVALNWPHRAPPAAVEPGMLAEGQGKLMAPSAALATAPPREEPNVAGERPQVHETRHDEYQEMLSFKGHPTSDKDMLATASTKPLVSAPPLESIVGEDAPSPPRSAPPLAAEPNHPASTVLAAPRAVALAAKPTESAADPSVAKAAPDLTALSNASPAPPAPPRQSLPAVAPQEPGISETARIEARLSEVETALKDRSSDPSTRLESERAQTQALEQIARLAAIVTRLTGQVRDLQDQIHTLTTGSDEKLADLTRRVALGEANRAVESAEGTVATRTPASESSASSSAGDRQAVGSHAKINADVKRSYRIQAASPGLAMLTAIDDGSDDRPVEVAIGTDLPGYGKVRSIEQHGEAWVVKAERGAIQ